MSENEDLRKRIAVRNVRIITALRSAGIGPDVVTGAAMFEIGVELLVVGGVDRDALEVRFQSLMAESRRLRSMLQKVNGNPMAAEPPLPQ